MTKIINLILVLSIIVLMMACISADKTRGFKTNGIHLLDSNGNEFVIRGVNNPSVWYPVESYNALGDIAKHNVNCVRIVWDTRGETDELEKVISKCINFQMIPMVELHDATGDSTAHKLMRLTNYFIKEDVKEMLLRYENYLLINIANEWGDHTMKNDYWYTAYKQSVGVLRKAGYKTTLVIDGSGWGQNISPILNHGKDLIDDDKEHNLLFSVHMYGSWNDATKIENDLKDVCQQEIPIIVGEFGYSYNNGDNNLGCKVNCKQILKTCADLNIGYLAWSWTGNNEENKWLNLVEHKDWATLTTWGKEVFNTSLGIKETAQKASVFND